MDEGKIRWLIEQEIENRKLARLIQMLKSMTDTELIEYKKRMEDIK